MKKHIGVRIEDGIYCLESTGAKVRGDGSPLFIGGEDELLEQNLAMVCRPAGPSPTYGVYARYMAFGRKHYARLGEIADSLGHEGYIFRESGRGENASANPEPVPIPIPELDLKPDSEPAQKTSLKLAWGYTKAGEEGGGAEELVRGTGIRGIAARHSTPLAPAGGFTECAIACRLGESLVLVHEDRGKYVWEAHPLRLMDGLQVRERRALTPDLSVTVIHTVISRGRDKLMELLTPEAWRLWQEEQTSRGNIGRQTIE